MRGYPAREGHKMLVKRRNISFHRPRILFTGLSLIVAVAGCACHHTATISAPAWTQYAPIPDSLGVAGAFAGVSHDALLLAGGANFPERMPWDGGKKVWRDAVYVLEDPHGPWKTAGQLPRPLAYGVSIQTRDGVLCIGGNDADRVYADAFVLTWENGRLHTRPFPALPRPAVNACGTQVGSLVMVAGGETTLNAVESVSSCWCIDLNAVDKGWQTLPAWPGEKRTLAVAASLGGFFYIAGGVALSAGPDGKPARRYLQDGYAFHPEKGTWRRIADMPHPFAAVPTPAPPMDATHFALLGGDDGSKYGFQPVQQHPGFCNDLLIYDTVTDSWSVNGNAPAPRATLTAVSWRGRVVLPSGELRPGVRSPEVWTWQNIAKGTP
jgi:N-acetylneuraminate epimerase